MVWIFLARQLIDGLSLGEIEACSSPLANSVWLCMVLSPKIYIDIPLPPPPLPTVPLITFHVSGHTICSSWCIVRVHLLVGAYLVVAGPCLAAIQVFTHTRHQSFPDKMGKRKLLVKGHIIFIRGFNSVRSGLDLDLVQISPQLYGRSPLPGLVKLPDMRSHKSWMPQ